MSDVSNSTGRQPSANLRADAAASSPVGGFERQRRPRWVAIAAATAAALVIGGAGFGLGVSTGSTDATGSIAPISMTGSHSQAATDESAATEALGDTVEGDSLARFIGLHYFTSEGLSEFGGEANAYGLDARSSSTIERVSALARALGLESAPELRDDAWLVGSRKGTENSLVVELDGRLSFWYENVVINPWDCASTEESKGDGSAETVFERCATLGQPPSEDAALDALRSVLTGAGHDVADFELSTEVYDDFPTRTAEALHVLDGETTGLRIAVEVGEEGLMYAWGYLADSVELGRFQVSSEQEVFERLSDPRFGASLGLSAVPLENEVTEHVAPIYPPATPDGGSTLAWPATNVHIVSARLVMSDHTMPDGGVLIAPTYEFTDAEGRVWTVIAVDESQLDFGN